MECLTPNQRVWRRFKRNRLALACALFLAALFFVILLAPLFLPYSPLALSEEQFAPPNADHWFGTDVHGRDLLARIVYGTRISFLVGAAGTGVSLLIGVTWGAVAGYVGGRWDSVMMRLVDILYSLPSIVFVIVLITTLEDFFKNWLGRLGWLNQMLSSDLGATARLLFLFVGLGAVSWLTMARIVRGEVLSLKSRNFVDASRALGASPARILFRHILPNVSGVVLVYLALTVPSVVLYESFLSYLGLGIQAPQASLGSLIADGASQINPIRIYWWLIIFPGVTLVSTLLALNFLGDGLRDAWDPRAGN